MDPQEGIMNPLIQNEFDRRINLWKQILEKENPGKIEPKFLIERSLSGGQQGIWVDKARTGRLTEDGSGITVSIMHRGSVYADDLSDEGVIYHYPETNRPKTRDESEIIATKNAGNLGLPVFVVTPSNDGPSFRTLRLGWVQYWDDASKLFYVKFGEILPSEPSKEEEDDDQDFYLDKQKEKKKGQRSLRPGQLLFRFKVFKRYGIKYAVCGLDIKGLLDTAHIKPDNKNGSDHPQNGIVLCATHHRAFDAGFFAIEPYTFKIYCRSKGPDLSNLRIKYPSIEHLPRKPHFKALAWFWEKWRKTEDYTI